MRFNNAIVVNLAIALPLFAFFLVQKFPIMVKIVGVDDHTICIVLPCNEISKFMLTVKKKSFDSTPQRPAIIVLAQALSINGKVAKKKGGFMGKPFLRLLHSLLFSILLCPALAQAHDVTPLSISMESYDYPHKVEFLNLTIEGQDLRMAYMDIAPQGNPTGKVVVLLHGKNFFGAYWKQTISTLSKNGYRVIVPDQIGFGKSSKPNIHYSFHLLASNTKKLLDTLGIKEVSIVG